MELKEKNFALSFLFVCLLRDEEEEVGTELVKIIAGERTKCVTS